MTEGGSTNGILTSTSITVLKGDGFCESHHAMGTAIKNKMTVVNSASCKVSNMGAVSIIV